MSVKTVQCAVDTFYWSHGPCCAGCDWWEHYNSVVGACTRSAPVSSQERWGMCGISSNSAPSSAGHVMTPREHHCGDFKDEFDWQSLTLAYRKSIGAGNGEKHGG